MTVTSLPETGFCDTLIAHNNLAAQEFTEWSFYPGMLFNSIDKWWGTGGRRDKPHEGIDVCLFQGKTGSIKYLNKTAKIPAIYNGTIVQIINDYIGKTVFVNHAIYDRKGNQLYSICGHVEPYNGAASGADIDEGKIFATIADNGNIRVKMLPHVHVSVAWIPGNFPAEKLSWDIMHDDSLITLLNPLDVLGCRYSVVQQLK